MIRQGISSGHKHGSHLKALFKLEVEATKIIQTSCQVLRGKKQKNVLKRNIAQNLPHDCHSVNQRTVTQHHLVEVLKLTSISSSIPPSSACWDRRAAVCRAKVILSKENKYLLLIELLESSAHHHHCRALHTECYCTP